jgi:multiple sugar transport system substrate-binding protein
MDAVDDTVRLLCWDDPRATGPLTAAIEAYGSVAPAVRIELTTRPLSAFNDEPIEQAAERADLIVFDHPMVPKAATAQVLRPLDDLIAQPDIADRPETVGGSADSYRWQGRTWGLAIDAACQVMAVRHDLLVELDAEVPATFDDLLAFADEHPGRTIVPLYPSDAICTLISLSVAHARDLGEPDTWLHRDAIDSLLALVARCDPRGFGRNPPAVLAEMREHDRWALAPFTFGYANVSRQAGLRPVTWSELPLVGRARGSVLGGAGLGISASSPRAEGAMAFARWFTQPTVQRDLAVAHGGQPADRTVWDDPAADAATNGFFSGTRRTIDAAYRRPAHPWWPQFQERGGSTLVELLNRNADARTIHEALTRLHEHHEAESYTATSRRPDEGET